MAPSVYFFGEDVMRVGIVVASELPRERSTLLVRLMAGGPGLPDAIRDLLALPRDAHERAVATQILLQLGGGLIKKKYRTPEEEDVIVVMQDTWEKKYETGRKEGQLAHARATLCRVLAR